MFSIGAADLTGGRCEGVGEREGEREGGVSHVEMAYLERQLCINCNILLMHLFPLLNDSVGVCSFMSGFDRVSMSSLESVS